MKTLVVVAAGAADRPLAELGGRTPLEAAATPMLDRIVREGRLGRLTPAPEGLRSEEGAFALGLFGLDPKAYRATGGALDATAFDVIFEDADLVFRLSLVTADEQTLFDPTAGSVSRDEAALLLEALDDALADDDIELHAGDGVHNVLVWKGARDASVRTVPPYEVVGKRLSAALPRGPGTTPLVAVIQRSQEILGAHEVNELRRDLGENAATTIWPWGPGAGQDLPEFAERTGVRACAVGADPLFVGAARWQGIDVLAIEGATGRPDSNVRTKTEAALDALDAHDLVFLHIGGLAAASHVRDFSAKVETLERIDGYALRACVRALETGLEARLVVIGGPAVSCESGRVLADAVPLVIFGRDVKGHRKGAFTEVAARDAGFHVEHAHELLDFLLHLPG